MHVGWEDVAAHTGGEMVAGTLIARISGKHVVLGQQRGTQFDFTPLGAQIAEELAESKIKAAVASAKPKRASAPKDEAAASDNVAIKVEPQPQELDLDLE